MSRDFKHIKGGKELDAMLKTLPIKMERNIMRSALRAGAVPIRDEARANVAVDQGELKKSIKITTSSKRGKVTAKVQTKVRHAHLVEFDTAGHIIKAKGAGPLEFGGTFAQSVLHPGTKAQPYMRPALDAKADAAIAAVGQQVRTRLTVVGLNAPAGSGDDQ